MHRFALIIAISMLVGGCATYNYAEKVRMVSFTDEPTKGESAGPIRGEDCTFHVMGHQLGGAPTLDKAFRNAMNQASAIESAGFGALNENKGRGDRIRYVNNVHTNNEGFDAVIFGKRCLVVTGVGYR